MLSATASLGLVLLWDVEGGLTEIDKFLYSNEEAIKVHIILSLVSHLMFLPPSPLPPFAGRSPPGLWDCQLWCEE